MSGGFIRLVVLNGEFTTGQNSRLDAMLEAAIARQSINDELLK